MKAKLIFIAICIALLLFQSCSKDDSTPTGNPDPNMHDLPPFGMIFPKTYSITGRYKDYHAWIHNFDVTSLYPEKYFFQSDEWPNIKMVFNSGYEMVFKDSLGNLSPDKYTCFFRRDTFYLVITETISGKPVTLDIPVGLGTYSAINITQGEYLISGHDSSGMGSGQESGSNSFYTSREDIISKHGTWFQIIDTIAFRNTGVMYK